MSRFFAYEEYGAKFEMMDRDLRATYRIPNTDDAFEKGIEVLSRTLESLNNRTEHGQKGVTFGDLVIKVHLRHVTYLQYCLANNISADSTSAKVSFALREAPPTNACRR